MKFGLFIKFSFFYTVSQKGFMFDTSVKTRNVTFLYTAPQKDKTRFKVVSW